MTTEWTNLRETEATVEVGLADSTRSAGKPRTWGSSGGRLSSWSRETFPAQSEVGEECPHNWTRSRHPTSATWGARCGKSARRVLRGGTGTRALLKTRPYPPRCFGAMDRKPGRLRTGALRGVE